MRAMRILSILCLCASVLWTQAEEISVPDRPADHLLDQTGTITAEQRAEVKAEMNLVRDRAALGIYLVLLKVAPEEPPVDLARRLAGAWNDETDRAVLLSCAEMNPPLVVAVSGQTLGNAPDALLQTLQQDALAAGAKAAPGLPALRSAADAVVEKITAWRAQPAATTALPPVAQTDTLHPGWWIGGGAFAGLLLALLFLRRGRKTALIFPRTEFRQRFSAPHSGGNDAMIFFGKP